MKGNFSTILCALMGLLVFEISCQAPENLEEEVTSPKLGLQKNYYKLMFNHLKQHSAPVIEYTCPDGWFQVEDQCFFLSTKKQDFSKSAAKCKDIGAHLAKLTTREQHEAVEKERRRLGWFETYYWIGLSDSEKEGDWKWVDKSMLTTSFWNVERSEPDNHPSGGPEGEDCAVMDSFSNSWYDVPCGFLYKRICQKPADPLIDNF